MNNSTIQINNLEFSYGKKSHPTPIVLNIKELKIENGEKVFLYGPSGFGKSTLLNILAGVLEVEKGSVEVLGKNLHSISQSARDHLRGEEVGYIFQT